VLDIKFEETMELVILEITHKTK